MTRANYLRILGKHADGPGSGLFYPPTSVTQARTGRPLAAWVAPVTPGYDKQLAGGISCVQRKGGQTLKTLFDGDAATKPEDFGLIRWNEITEGTYIDPMTCYGSQDLICCSRSSTTGPDRAGPMFANPLP